MPTASGRPSRALIATTDGSSSTTPRPRTYTSVFAVPRSTAMSRPITDEYQGSLTPNTPFGAGYGVGTGYGSRPPNRHPPFVTVGGHGNVFRVLVEPMARRGRRPAAPPVRARRGGTVAA